MSAKRHGIITCEHTDMARITGIASGVSYTLNARSFAAVLRTPKLKYKCGTHVHKRGPFIDTTRFLCHSTTFKLSVTR